MRLKAKEPTDVILTKLELKQQIISQFKPGDILHITKSKRRISKKEIKFVQGFDSFFTAEIDINIYYSEVITIAYADLLVGNVAITEIQTTKPIVK